ncbi:hypothetical protein, partial [Brevibacillus agri]
VRKICKEALHSICSLICADIARKQFVQRMFREFVIEKKKRNNLSKNYYPHAKTPLNQADRLSRKSTACP